MFVGYESSALTTACGLGFNRSTQQIGQSVLPVFDSLVFFCAQLST